MNLLLSVYVIAKNKFSCFRKAVREAPIASHRPAQIEQQNCTEQDSVEQIIFNIIKEQVREAKMAENRAYARYRRYTIEEIREATENFAEKRKIGEGEFGPVYKCYLDHRPVAVKALRSEAVQGLARFEQEVEIMSGIRHPNMVLLLGACPEYGCLVYELMTNGSLDDCLLRRGNKPPISWQCRLRIAAEIGAALLFLHQTKPEPIVHQDLQPANILLDENYISKISHVGLPTLVSPSVCHSANKYRMFSADGTFRFIDPEYQIRGNLRSKSDIFSFGLLLLQIITGRQQRWGLITHVERGIENGTFKDLLDPSVSDWPAEDAECFMKLALKCTELKRKDRPDLDTVILPELKRLSALGEENKQCSNLETVTVASEISTPDYMSYNSRSP